MEEESPTTWVLTITYLRLGRHIRHVRMGSRAFKRSCVKCYNDFPRCDLRKPLHKNFFSIMGISKRHVHREQNQRIRQHLHQLTAASTWWCGPRTVRVRSKRLLDFPRVPVTPGTPLHFFALLPPERPQ